MSDGMGSELKAEMNITYNHSYRNPLRVKFDLTFFRGIPKRPGIYFMLNPQGSILYIGKAKNLRNRIRSYSHIRPENSAEHTLAMIGFVHTIRWQECRTETEAFARENELLHAIRPPYNIASTDPDYYLFIGLRVGKSTKNTYLNRNRVRLEFQLTQHDWIQENGYELFGCYKHRKLTKLGYGALIRLIYWATFEGKRFSCPARISGRNPCWLYAIDYPKDWMLPLRSFLAGRNRNLLHLLVENLLENECIPGFVRMSIQEDIEIVTRFFRMGPKKTRLLKKENSVASQVITHAQMDALIIRTVEQTAGLKVEQSRECLDVHFAKEA